MKTCEEYVLNELEELKKENKELQSLKALKDENARLQKVIDAFVKTTAPRKMPYGISFSTPVLWDKKDNEEVIKLLTPYSGEDQN